MVVYLPDGEQRRQALQGCSPVWAALGWCVLFPTLVLLCVCVFVCWRCVCLVWALCCWLAGRQGEVSLWHYEHTEDDLTLVPSSPAPTSPWIVYCTSVCSYNSVFNSPSQRNWPQQPFCAVKRSKHKTSHRVQDPESLETWMLKVNLVHFWDLCLKEKIETVNVEQWWWISCFANLSCKKCI